jgi:predicted enzyme related to lactoylglutathione lyase
MAVVADPTGAMFGIWEARDTIGAGRVNEDGCLTWNELATNDVEAAQSFYSDLFGWTFEQGGGTDGGPRYWLIGHSGGADGQNGGMRELSPEEQGLPPYWVPYIGAPSADERLAQAEKLGGGGLMPPMDVPAGRFAALRDPQGAVFCVFQGGYDD